MSSLPKVLDPLEFALRVLPPLSDPPSDIKDGLADLDSLVAESDHVATESNIWASTHNQPIHSHIGDYSIPPRTPNISCISVYRCSFVDTY